MTIANDTALVLFSGGQDSTVCLAWALERFARVETVGFNYGQRHVVELDVRPHLRELIAALKPEWGKRLGEDHMVSLDALAAAATASRSPPRWRRRRWTPAWRRARSPILTPISRS